MYEEMMDKAFAGMKADSGEDRVETWSAAASIPFGVIVGMDAQKRLVTGKGTRVLGIALHSHAVTGDGYVQYDPVSVMTRGLAWVKCAAGDTSATNSYVKFNAQGEILNSAADQYKIEQAIVRDTITTADGKLALIELR